MTNALTGYRQKPDPEPLTGNAHDVGFRLEQNDKFYEGTVDLSTHRGEIVIDDISFGRMSDEPDNVSKEFLGDVINANFEQFQEALTY